MNPQTDWATALAILTAGLILGVFFIYFAKKRKAATIMDGSDALVELEARRDALVEQLRDPSVQGAERARLEHETADVLRQLDGASRKAPKADRTAAAAPVATAAPAPQFAQAMKGFVWGVVTFGVLGGLGYVVMQQSAPREAGGSMTGAIPTEQAQQAEGHPMSAAPTDARVAKLQEEIKKNPADMQLRLALAQLHMQRNDLMGVHEVSKVILEREPENSLGLTYAAVVRAAMGETDIAVEMLHRAAKNQPSNLDAYVALAWVEAQKGSIADAEKAIAAGIAAVPGEKVLLGQVMDQIRNQMKVAAQAPPAQGGLPAGHPPTEVAMKK
jgi:tetratricopeptide (TPR) repeat protein